MPLVPPEVPLGRILLDTFFYKPIVPTVREWLHVTQFLYILKLMT